MKDTRNPEPATYDEWVSTLEPCSVCGRIDVMDNIEGKDPCAACYLDELSDDEDDEWWAEDDELTS